MTVQGVVRKCHERAQQTELPGLLPESARTLPGVGVDTFERLSAEGLS